MKERDPEEFRECVEFDATMRRAPGMTDERYLHESRTPLDIAIERARESPRSPGCAGPDVGRRETEAASRMLAVRLPEHGLRHR